MNECIPIEELGTVDQLPEDDARRRHVATCPRCSSLRFVHDAFVEEKPLESADTVDADARLSRFIETHIERPAVASVVPSPGRRRWFDLSGFRLAAAAAVLILVAVAVMRWQPWATEEMIYRGDAREQFSGLHAERAEGVVTLRWDAAAGADSYRVVILSEDLTEITRLPATTELSFRLDPKSVVSDHTPRFWQVSALAEGGELLTSDPQRLPD